MKKSKRIQVIVDIKAMQKKSALESLGLAQIKLQTLQDQINGLRNYRKEYQDNFDKLGVNGVNVSKLLEFRSFIDKLDKAIIGQEHMLIAIETEIKDKRKIWEELHQKTQSLQKVCDAALAVEIKQEAKREQIEQDERSSRIGRKNRHAES